MFNLVRRIRTASNVSVIDGMPTTASRSRSFLRSLNIWFWVIFGLPTLVAAVYYFAIASDLYMSEVKFVVRGGASGETPTEGSVNFAQGNRASAIFSGASGQSIASSENTEAVRAYLLSRDAVRRLEREHDLRKLLTRPEGDLLSRFPGIKFWREDFEALLDTYLRFVSIEVNGATGVSVMQVKAYRPEDAQQVAQALLWFSEQLINVLNDRSRREAHAMFQREVDDVEQRIANIQKELTAYRVSENILDPISAAMGPLKIVGQLNAQLASANAQLAEVLKNSPNSPQIPLVRTRIASLETLIADERDRMTGETDSVATALTEYERLSVRRLLAHKQLQSLFTSREAARLAAERQQLYLETVAQPNLADYPLYPRRILSFAIIAASCFAVYGVVWLLFLRRRAPA